MRRQGTAGAGERQRKLPVGMSIGGFVLIMATALWFTDTVLTDVTDYATVALTRRSLARDADTPSEIQAVLPAAAVKVAAPVPLGPKVRPEGLRPEPVRKRPPFPQGRR